MPNCTPSLIASQSRNPRRRTATAEVSLNRARSNMGLHLDPKLSNLFLADPLGPWFEGDLFHEDAQGVLVDVPDPGADVFFDGLVLG